MPTCKNHLNAITLPCPCCGEDDIGVSVRLDCLDDDDSQFHCHSCEADFGRNFISEIVTRWTPVLAWLEKAPGAEVTE